ncbi:MAG: cation:proton antiporter [Lachnospiraceae bacterium]|nr:cation:proton antiporter [Lachnospiraceae bacterium]
MQVIEVFRDLAIIIILAKICGIIARSLKAPQVVGEIIAGLLIGPAVFGLVEQTEAITFIAEIGVVMLMFVAGLETDLKELIKTGPIALAIACAGVFVPLLGGYLLYSCFYGFSPSGSEGFYRAVFMGVIMTATSVSITVQALRELGRLKGKVGTTILNAAIIDDVIGIIVLTFVIGFKNPEAKPISVVINTILFFLFSGVVGYLTYQLFNRLDKIAPHKQRIPIFSLGVCFAFAYIAEEYFGIADITGAYIAGVVLCSIQDSGYVSKQVDVSSYILFGPVFFISIGLKTELNGITPSLLLFSACFVAVALIAKVIGCGLTAKLCHFSSRDCLKIGVGMMTRGEVALIVAQKGLAVGLLDAKYFTSVILLIICSSIATPILLKLLYQDEPSVPRYYEG